MTQGHRSAFRWLKDHFRSIKSSNDTSASSRAKGSATDKAQDTAKPREDTEHTGKPTENEEQSGISASGNNTLGTQTHSSTGADHCTPNEDHAEVAHLGATTVVDEVVEDPAGQQATGENAPGPAPLTHHESAQVPFPDEESPIWIKAVERFEKEKQEEYRLIVGQIAQIQKLKDGDNWDTWLDGPGLDPATKETKYKWLRTCKAYMPSFGTVKGIAQNLSNLDPHKVAPLVTTGVFLLVELCFGIWDPDTRDKAIGFLLKTNIFISKWAFREGELRRMKMASMQKVEENVNRIEEKLGKLYLDSLLLISEIHKNGRTRYSRSKASLISGPSEWGRMYDQIQNGDAELGELRSQAELMLKAIEANVEALDWIWNRHEDPEPLHQTVKERTGVHDTSSMAGSWFLETSPFTSWVAGIRENTAENLVFWVKGSMGTGKTTLLCRAISHFDDSPIGGVKFVPYYCHGSGARPGPQYETIIRALCRRLAWNGSVVSQAMRLYQSSKSNPEAQVTVKKTWGPLFKELIASSSTTIVLVVDALDECKSFDDYMTLLEFLTKLPRGPNGPYLLVSSRPHVPVRRHFDGSIRTFDVVQPETRNDMRSFIDNQITSKSKQVRWEKSVFFKDHVLLEELKSALLESAGGMFRWVEIWLGVFFPRNRNAVERAVNAKKLLDQLKNIESVEELPHDKSDDSRDDKKKMAIKEAYEKLWEINGDYGQDKDLQVRLFQIITASFENLRPGALLEAVRFDPGDSDRYEELDSDQLEGLYSSFLKKNSYGCLEYEHFSAKMFVQDIRDSDKSVFSIEESHRTMAEIAISAMERPDHCIWKKTKMDALVSGEYARISMPDKRTEYARLSVPDKRPRFNRWNLVNLSRGFMDYFHFGPYLFKFWFDHCQMLRGDEQFIQRMSNFLQRANPAFEAWVNFLVENYGRYRDTLTRITRQGSEAIRPSPLLCMVSFGFSPISHNTEQPALLPGLEDPTVRNLDLETALHIACKASNTTIVEDLLRLECSRRGSCIEFLTTKDNRGQTPLHLAKDEDTVKILLRYEMNKSPDSPAMSGPRVSQLLQCKDKWGRMPILNTKRLSCSGTLIGWILHEYTMESQALEYLYYDAFIQGELEIVKLFPEKQTDPDIEFGSRRNLTLRFVVDYYNVRLAAFLIDHGASLDDRGEMSDILNRCAQYRNESMLELLFDKGVGVDTMRPQGMTVLGLAVHEQNTSIILYCLFRGADIYAPQGLFRRSALQLAAANGSLHVMTILLEHGVDVNASGKPVDHGTALGNSLLAECDGNTDPPFLGTPLAIAAYIGDTRMAKLLMENGADVGLLGTRARTALDTMLRNN